MLTSASLKLAIAAAVLTGCPQGETPGADPQTDESRRVAIALFDALSRADVEAIDSLYAADFEIWTAGSLPFSGRHDKAYALGATRMILGAFPKGLSFTIDAITAEGERVAIEAHSDGEHVSGRNYHNEYHFLLRVRDGQVIEFKEYLDTQLADEVLVKGAAAQP